MTAALEGGERSAARPGRTLPPGRTRYPFYRRLGGPQGRSGRAENSIPIGIRSRTALYLRERPGTHFTGGWVGPRAGLDGRKISSPLGFDPGPHFTSGKDPVHILQEAGWAPGPVWTGGKSRPHWDSIPDRPARSSVAIPTELPGPRR